MNNENIIQINDQEQQKITTFTGQIGINTKTATEEVEPEQPEQPQPEPEPDTRSEVQKIVDGLGQIFVHQEIINQQEKQAKLSNSRIIERLSKATPEVPGQYYKTNSTQEIIELDTVKFYLKFNQALESQLPIVLTYNDRQNKISIAQAKNAITKNTNFIASRIAKLTKEEKDELEVKTNKQVNQIPALANAMRQKQ